MTPAQASVVFAQINSNTPALKVWLEGEMAAAVVILTMNVNPATSHQAQGKVQFINQMLNLLGGSNKPLRP